jgi:hypothetical protein
LVAVGGFLQPLAVSVGASQDGKTEPLDTSQTGVGWRALIESKGAVTWPATIREKHEVAIPRGWFRSQPPTNFQGEDVMKLGATGKFPHGSLGPNDEGALQMGVSHDSNGNVHMNFGKHVSWIAFPSEQAIELAKLILRHAGAKKVEITL